ncbi:MAG: hypothetical protein WDN49_16390 [Acetobacteraceae bacterium]
MPDYGAAPLNTAKRDRGLGAAVGLGARMLAISQRPRLSTPGGLVAPCPARAEAAKRAAGMLLPQLFAPRARWLSGLLARLP